jgi:hypothetical protein
VAGIKRVLGSRHGGEDFTILTQAAMLEVFDNVINVVTLAVGAIAGISLLVGAIGILTMMWIAVGERTAEIGLLKAIGATSGQVQAAFLLEAVGLAVAGGALGLGAGMGLGALARAIVPGLPFSTPPLYVGLALALCVATGLVSGVAPARRAAQLDPVEALRADCGGRGASTEGPAGSDRDALERVRGREARRSARVGQPGLPPDREARRQVGPPEDHLPVPGAVRPEDVQEVGEGHHHSALEGRAQVAEAEDQVARAAGQCGAHLDLGSGRGEETAQAREHGRGGARQSIAEIEPLGVCGGRQAEASGDDGRAQGETHAESPGRVHGVVALRPLLPAKPLGPAGSGIQNWK